MKVVFPAGRISPETVRIHGAPSDSTTTSSGANTPFRCTNCSRRAANPEVRPAPSADRALSMRTPAAPLFRSFRGSPVFGSGRSASRQTTAFASLVFAEPHDMALESRRRNLHAGEIPELAARLLITVGTRGVRIKAFRAGRGRPAFQIQRPVQRETAAAALAAAETAPLDPDRSEARPERLPDPAVTVHPPAATRAGRGGRAASNASSSAATPPRSTLNGPSCAACSSVKPCKNAANSGWRNSASRIFTAMMTFAARAPDARRPPCAGLRKPPRDRSMLNRAGPDCNPRTQNPSDTRKRGATRFHKNGMHPATIRALFCLSGGGTLEGLVEPRER